MLWRRIAALAVCFATFGALAANQAATIQLADGDARIVSGGVERKAKPGDAVNEGNTLVTGTNGEIHLAMQDAGFMVVRPNTRFLVVGYAAEGDENDKGVFRLIAGGVRSITGWIGKFNARSYQIQTNNATVGIRGTDHETRVVAEGSAEGEPGTYDRVYEGETVLESKEGTARITKDQSGFLSTRPRDKPRRLAAIPAFYRAGPHEAAIARKHAEIQRVVAERREERRKLMQERRSSVNELKAKAKEAREEGKELTPEQKRELAAKREALQRDARAAREMHADIQKSRKSLEEDVKGRRITREEARDRRKALAEKEKAYEDQQVQINARLKDLNETADSILR
jgi:hypothetical protein